MRKFSTLILSVVLSFSALAQPGGTAGAFSRMGFGARGMGMGNALTAVPHGLISSHYNPALTPFQEGNVLYGSYSFLALDRQLNQVSYTQGLPLYGKRIPGTMERELVSVAGISIGWINAGDANIQGYDSDGFKTEILSVFENQFYLNFGNKFSEKFAAGFNIKFYHSGLYKDVTSSGFGVDLGILYSITPNIHVAVVAQELLTKYKWDTGQLYGPQNGNTTENSFARILRVGGSYVSQDQDATAAADVELWDGETILLRVGGEYRIVEQLTLRAGIERVDLSSNGIDARPSLGMTVAQPAGAFLPMISYALIFEPVAPTATHVLSFALSF